jgi:6-phosphogluconolactonase (cycloisomerase 2 family)
MLKYMRWPVWSFVLLVVFSAALNAQNFVYTNNDLAGANSVSAFSVDTNGALSQIAGSPFLTQGTGSGGGLYSANRVIVVNDFLYASNSASNTVSAFSIDPGSGYLTPVNGSPFSTGAFNDPQNSGISLAATPDGKYLYAGSTGYDAQFNSGPITVFSIDSTGALTVAGKSPVSARGAMSGMKVTPDGKYLIVVIPATRGIAVFAIHGPRNLHEIHNSPYILSSEPATSVDINCPGNLLFAGGTGGDIYAFNFASGGLSAVAGSPFATGNVNNGVVELSTDDHTLFTSNQSGNTVTAFAVAGDGSLTVPGTSVNAAGLSAADPNPYPGALAVSNDGLFLFGADLNYSSSGGGGFSVFGLTGSTPISFVSLNSTGQSSGLQSLAAYPAKSCTSAALKPQKHGK